MSRLAAGAPANGIVPANPSPAAVRPPSDWSPPKGDNPWRSFYRAGGLDNHRHAKGPVGDGVVCVRVTPAKRHGFRADEQPLDGPIADENVRKGAFRCDANEIEVGDGDGGRAKRNQVETVGQVLRRAIGRDGVAEDVADIATSTGGPPMCARAGAAVKPSNDTNPRRRRKMPILFFMRDPAFPPPRPDGQSRQGAWGCRRGEGRFVHGLRETGSQGGIPIGAVPGRIPVSCSRSPSPQPAPARSGSRFPRTSPTRTFLSAECGRSFSLSQRERTGVRENASIARVRRRSLRSRLFA